MKRKQNLSKNRKKGRYLILFFALLGIIGLYYRFFCYTQPIKNLLPTSGRTASIILIDGLSNDIFKHEITQGKLPHLAQLIAQSTYIENGICSFPTMTGYGYYPFITGIDAPQSGILGLRWFDRARANGKFRNYVGRTHIHMNRDIDPNYPTLFETYKENYTASINSFMNKGVHDAQMTGWAHTTAKYEGKSIFAWLRAIPLLGKHIAKNHFEHESDVLQIALQQLEKNPKIQWITFPSPDAYNHIAGIDSTYYKLLYHIDSLIGQFIQRIDQLGQTQQRLIAIVSDHGIADVHQNINFANLLQQTTGLHCERGNSVNIWSNQLSDNNDTLQNIDAYFVINGNLCGYLYLKNTDESTHDNWARKPTLDLITKYPKNGKTIDLPNTIRQFDGIELVAYKQNDSTLLLANAQGYAQITQTAINTYQYDTLTADPLRYAQHKHLIGKAYTAEQWLDLSTAQNIDYPYAPPRLFEVMRPKTAPDLLFTAQKGYDLARDYEIVVHNYQGGHGGLRRELISVPYILHIPQQKADTLYALSNEKVGQLIKKYLEGK